MLKEAVGKVKRVCGFVDAAIVWSLPPADCSYDDNHVLTFPWDIIPGIRYI